jgi:hypothetical protein
MYGTVVIPNKHRVTIAMLRCLLDGEQRPTSYLVGKMGMYIEGKSAYRANSHEERERPHALERGEAIRIRKTLNDFKKQGHVEVVVGSGPRGQSLFRLLDIDWAKGWIKKHSERENRDVNTN